MEVERAERFEFAFLEMFRDFGRGFENFYEVSVVAAGSGFFCHHLARAPNINRRTMSTGGFARDHARSPQCPANRSRKSFVPRFAVLRFQVLVSSSCGLSPELSYTVHASASGL